MSSTLILYLRTYAPSCERFLGTSARRGCIDLIRGSGPPWCASVFECVCVCVCEVWWRGHTSVRTQVSVATALKGVGRASKVRVSRIHAPACSAAASPFELGCPSCRPLTLLSPSTAALLHLLALFGLLPRQLLLSVRNLHLRTLVLLFVVVVI